MLPAFAGGKPRILEITANPRLRKAMEAGKAQQMSVELLANKLSTPLSAGVRYFGFVNKGIRRKETPLAKKLVNTYLPTDL